MRYGEETHYYKELDDLKFPKLFHRNISIDQKYISFGMGMGVKELYGLCD